MDIHSSEPDQTMGFRVDSSSCLLVNTLLIPSFSYEDYSKLWLLKTALIAALVGCRFPYIPATYFHPCGVWPWADQKSAHDEADRSWPFVLTTFFFALLDGWASPLRHMRLSVSWHDEIPNRWEKENMFSIVKPVVFPLPCFPEYQHIKTLTIAKPATSSTFRSSNHGIGENLKKVLRGSGAHAWDI